MDRKRSEAKKLSSGQMVGLAVAGVALAFGLGIGVDRLTHRPPPVAVVAVQPKAEPEGIGGVIVDPKQAEKEKGNKVQVATTKTDIAPLPPKFNDKGERMYLDVRWINDRMVQIAFLGKHLGLVPGKGYCKLMPLEVKDHARPFANTEGKWISTDPPVYQLWPRTIADSLPSGFRPVYIRAGVWYLGDLERGYVNGEQIVVARLSNEKNRFVQIGPKKGTAKQ